MFEDLETLCLFWGTHRSLSTLFSIILSLHPNCIIANHGLGYLGINRPCDMKKQDLPEIMKWLIDYSGSSFRKFIKELFKCARGPSKIDRSGLFGLRKNRDTWNNYAPLLESKKPLCIGCKDGFPLSNMLETLDGFSFDDLFSKDERIRFFMPIRNIIDIAYSYSTGPKKLPNGDVDLFIEVNSEEKEKLENLIVAVGKRIARFVELKREYPDRFFYITQYSDEESKLKALLDFLKLPFNETWMKGALAFFQITDREYKHTGELRELAYNTLNNNLKIFPEHLKPLCF